MVIRGLAKKSVLLAALSLFLIAGFGYFMGVMFPPKIQAATTPGTCLPVSKGGTGCFDIEFLNKIYPIGSIYISTTNTNPSAFLGGTWQAFGGGRTLVGVGSNGTTNYGIAEATGGTDTVSLTAAQNGLHTHIANAHGHGGTGNGTLATYNFLMVDAASGSLFPQRSIASGTGSVYEYFGRQSSGLTAQASSGTAQTTVTLQNSGSGTAHENRMPYITVYYWKRTS